LYIGVTSTAQNGFSQNASSTPPMGTWEAGVFDYDDLIKNYLPSYTRYWDDQSKVPFLFNPSKGIWITYDDVQSNTVKNNYILQEKLLGAMFWEFSCDRHQELINNTYEALNGGKTPPTPQTTTVTTPTPKTTATTTHTTTSNTTATTTHTSTSTTTATTTSGKVSLWEVNHSYNVGDRVRYDANIYQCREAHRSQADWTPPAVPALWELVGPGFFFFRFRG